MLGQTHEDFELVIVDDCETDRTLEIARIYERLDLRRGRVAAAWQGLPQSGMRARDWLRYLRPTARDTWAGTPLDPGGDFVVPQWARPDRSPIRIA